MPISSTGRGRSSRAASVRLQRHCSRCFSLRHSRAFASSSASAISPNVGLLAPAASRWDCARIEGCDEPHLGRRGLLQAPPPRRTSPAPFRGGVRARRTDRPMIELATKRRKGRGPHHRGSYPVRPLLPCELSASRARRSPIQSPSKWRIIANPDECARTPCEIIRLISGSYPNAGELWRTIGCRTLTPTNFPIPSKRLTVKTYLFAHGASVLQLVLLLSVA